MSTKFAALVLCGGQSTRMGRPKASLPFGPETMLQRVVSQLDASPQPPEAIVLVAAQTQPLPQVQRLSGPLLIARDQFAQQGPMEGLIAGMQCLNQHRLSLAQPSQRDFPSWIFATSCDVPLLSPRWPQQLLALADNNARVVVPFDDQFHHPLAAAYHLDVLPTLEKLRNNRVLRPRALFDQVATTRVPVDKMRQIDPDLETLANLNTPDDYHAALRRCGYEMQTEA